MNVLSLFDGISCARIALDHSGIAVGKYYASEIDKFAIKVSKHNYPDIIHLGDVSDWVNWDIDWSSIDLVIGGFPCQSFSLAGKHGGFDDPRGQLFFKQVEIIKHIKSLNPNVKFIVENVILNDDNREVVDIALGTKPVIIDSALVSAQLRKRMYWCNFEVDQPHDCGIYYQDILEDGEAALLKAYTLTATYYKRGSAETRLRQWNRSQRPIVWLGDDETRWLYPVEAERLQTVPQYVKRVEVLLCSDQAESFVAAVEKNPKLLKLVVSAESEKLKEYVKHANRNTSVNPVKIKFTALQNADTRTQKQTGKCTKVNQKEQSLTANSAENTLMYKQAGSGGSSVTESVFIDITEGLITHLGGGGNHTRKSNRIRNR